MSPVLFSLTPFLGSLKYAFNFFMSFLWFFLVGYSLSGFELSMAQPCKLHFKRKALFFYLCIGVFYLCVCLVPVEANRGFVSLGRKGNREGCEDSELGAEP